MELHWSEMRSSFEKHDGVGPWRNGLHQSCSSQTVREEREIFCGRRLPFPWLCSGNVIPCSFMMQRGFPLWIAIAYAKAQYSSCQNPRDLVGNRGDLCSCLVAFSFSRVRSVMSHTGTVGNCLFLVGRKHRQQTYCL